MATILQVSCEIFEKYDVGQGFPGGSLEENPPAKARDAENAGLIPGSRRFPGGEMESTPGFLFRKSHGQRNMVNYSPWYCKELDKAQ